MDDDLAKLEDELRALTPAAPSPHLLAGIAEALAAPDEAAQPTRSSPEHSRIWWLSTLAVAAAACFAAAFLVTSRHRSAGQPDLLKPVSAKDVLYSAADEGLVTLDDGVAARKQRLEYVGTITWRDPKTKASLTWTVPREEVRYVPVRYQ